MTDPQDDQTADVYSDGELSEDSLFEWDGDQWVPVEHKPYTPFGRGRWYPEDPSVFSPDWDGRSPVRRRSRPRYLRMKSFWRVLVVLVIFLVCGAIILKMSSDQLSAVYPPSTRVVPSTNRVATVTPPAFVNTSVLYDCVGDVPSPAYIFLSSRTVIAQALEDPQSFCLLHRLSSDTADPRLSVMGNLLFYRSGSRIWYINLDRYRSFLIASSDDGDVTGYALSPDNRYVIFVADGMLHRRDLYISGNVIFHYTQLAEQTTVTYPVWSPDGSQILFTAESRIARIAADGSDYTVIYDNPSYYPYQTMVAWSPDGSQIASLYSLTPESENRGLLVMDRDGTNMREIIPAGDRLLSDPQWLADGQQIAVLQRDSAEADPVIAIYDLEGMLVSSVAPRYPIDVETSGFQIWYSSE